MDNTSKVILGIFAGLCAVWDAYTTYGGMVQVAGSPWIATLFTLFINGAILISFAPVSNDFVKVILVIITITAIACDAYTAYLGNLKLLLSGSIEHEIKIGIGIGMTIISVGSSLLVSYMIFEE